MKSLIMITVFGVLSHIPLVGQDLSAEVAQSTFNKVIASMPMPFTLFEHHEKFKMAGDAQENIFLDDTLYTKIYTEKESRDIYVWAFNENITKSEEEDVYRSALQAEWEKVKEQMQAYIDEYDRLPGEKKEQSADKSDVSYDELSIEEMRAIQAAPLEKALEMFSEVQKGAFAVKGHLAYFRADLDSRPTLKIESPNFKVNNIRIGTTVTGELWSKLPEFHCCRRFLGVCICVRVDWKWKRIASVTLSPNIGADAKVTFSQKNLKVIAHGEFSKLFLDHWILRNLNLAGVANHYLKNKSFEVYDAGAFVASLPYINSAFRIESIKLPDNKNGVSVQVNVKQ